MVHDTVYCDKRPIDVKPVYFMANNFRLSRSEQAMQLPLKLEKFLALTWCQVVACFAADRLDVTSWLACRTALKQELLQLGYSAVLFFFLAFFGCGNRFMK